MTIFSDPLKCISWVIGVTSIVYITIRFFLMEREHKIFMKKIEKTMLDIEKDIGSKNDRN